MTFHVNHDPPAPRPPDTGLIARVIAGDRRAERELYDAYAPRIYRLVYRLSGDDDLAQDFTQETFIRAFDRLESFRGESMLSTWLHRIAITVTLNGMRKVRQLRDREAELDGELPADPASDGLQRSEPDLRARLTAAVDALPEIYRAALVMHDIEGYTHTEIASIFRLPEGTSRRRLSMARARLRHVLAAFVEGRS